LPGLAAEAVEHPRHGGPQFAPQAEQEVERLDAMDDKRLPHLFPQPDVLPEHSLLDGHRRPTQGIEAALADGKNASLLRFKRGGNDELPRFTLPLDVLGKNIPRVDAPSVASVNDGYNVLLLRDMVCVEVDVAYHFLSYRVEWGFTQRGASAYACWSIGLRLLEHRPLLAGA